MVAIERGRAAIGVDAIGGAHAGVVVASRQRQMKVFRQGEGIGGAWPSPGRGVPLMISTCGSPISVAPADCRLTITPMAPSASASAGRVSLIDGGWVNCILVVPES